MKLIKNIQPIGDVDFSTGNFDFPHLADLSKDLEKIKEQDKIQAYLHYNQNIIQQLITNQISEFYTCSPELYLRNKSAEELQLEGIVITGFNQANPYGTYCLNAINRPFQPFNFKDSKFDIYRFTKFPNPNFSIITQAPQILSADQIDNAGFSNLTTQAQVLSLCSLTQDGVYKWSPSRIYPDGRVIMQNLNSSNQYAQSGFEGLAAMVAENGDIFVTRPFDNARRLQSTCISIGMPPVSEEQFFESIKYALIANKQFLPSPGSNAKMYIRPFVQGINGGTGVAPATEYLFSVQVFPFGNYFANRESVINLVALENTRRSFKHGMGNQKVASNYGPTFTHKMQAKQGLLDQYPGQSFNDVYYFGTSIDPHTQQEIEVLEEDAAGNIFFVSKTSAGLTISTPSLTRGTILPGFTRDTVLKIANRMGAIVEEKDHITWEDMHHFQGAFLSGSAAGIVRIASMSYKGETITYNTQNEENADFVAYTYYNIYDILYNLRRGKLDGFADCPEISSIPVKIANIFEI